MKPAPPPGRTDPATIRNFCIIAHIDHGKSTLADRMLQLTGVVDERSARAQYLDRMDIERERGITIKSQAVRMPWTVEPGNEQGAEPGTYVLNMIDTPGHVDFTYEVSRSLEACEAAILLVDAAQGIEAQTLANLYLALARRPPGHPGAQQDRPAERQPGEVRRGARRTSSAASRETCCRRERQDRRGRRRACSTRSSSSTPAPVGDADAPARALIFDSVYDTYRGVITYVRVIDGKLSHRDRIKMMSTGAIHEMLELGVISPEPVKAGEIGVGEVGYLITGVKDVRQSRVGDTVTTQHHGAVESLGGYKHPNPMVYAGLYPIDGDDFGDLREALEKLQLNDAALAYEPETSGALGFGFRCGFLGLLHMEITRDRLEREFGLDLISTAPNVVYEVVMEDGSEHRGHQPERVPGRQDRRGPRAGRPGHDPVAQRLHRHDHGALPDQARHPARDGLPLRGPRRDALHAPDGRDRLRLLRPAEVPDQGLRLARLRALRRAGGRPGQGRHPAPGRAGRRVQRDRAPATRRTPTA